MVIFCVLVLHQNMFPEPLVVMENAEMKWHQYSHLMLHSHANSMLVHLT